jgi:hypothetical protein
VIRDWDGEGVENGYGAGYLHGLYDGEGYGPQWEVSTIRWLEDFGSASAEDAADALAERLAEWFTQSGIGIVRVQFGS